MNAVDLKEFRQTLDDYHTELLSVAQLTAHLLDLMIDANVEPWQVGGAYLMRNRLMELAEGLPFPSVTRTGDVQDVTGA